MCCAGMKNALMIFYMLILFTFKFPPFLLVLTSCSKTLYTSYKQEKLANVQLSQLTFNGFSFEDVRTIRSQTQASTIAKALGIIVAVFLICYTIDIARLICCSFHCRNDIPQLLEDVQDLLFVFNSASNPLVYAFLKQDIGRELKRFVNALGFEMMLVVNCMVDNLKVKTLCLKRNLISLCHTLNKFHDQDIQGKYM